MPQRSGAPARRPVPRNEKTFAAPRVLAQIIQSRGAEIEGLLQRLSDVDDAMSRCGPAALMRLCEGRSIATSDTFCLGCA